MSFAYIMSVLIGIGGALSLFFFRRGGIYNPSQKPDPSTDGGEIFIPGVPLEPQKPLPQPPIATKPAPLNLLWDTRQNVRHSVRVICDAEGLDLEQKNTLCATVGAESIGYNTKAVNPNYVIKNGKKVLSSTDWGLCQWNDYYHGSEISGGYAGEAMNNPEKAVRLMCQYWKRGQRNLWVAYKNGSYKAYL